MRAPTRVDARAMRGSGELAERMIAPDCRSGLFGARGFESLTHHHARVAQRQSNRLLTGGPGFRNSPGAQATCAAHV